MRERWKSKMRMWPRTLWLFSLMFGLSYFATNVVGITTVYAGARQHNTAANTIEVTQCGTFGAVGTSGTLADALDSAGTNDTIHFSCSSVSGPMVLSTPIAISKNLTLQGPVTLSGNNTTAVISLTGSTTLTLSNLTIINGRATTQGGAISIGTGSTVTSTGDSFTSNTAGTATIFATSGIGGAIYIDSGGTFNSTNDSFTSNTVTNGTSGMALNNGYGGAIYNNQGTVSISTDTFTGNSAASGGAIYNYSGSTFTSSNDTFTGNHGTNGINPTGSYGGAIYNDTNTFTSTNDTFTGNTATNGGAITNAGGTLTLDGSSFSSNNATANGGAIYNASGTLTGTASPVSFSSNTATNGGAIYNTFSSFSGIGSLHRTRGIVPHTSRPFVAGTVTLTGGTFSSNNATTNGGAIYNNTGTINSATDTFSSNTANGNGGAIYNDGGGTFSSTADTFKSSHAVNGGAIASKASTVTLAGGIFGTNPDTKNSASANGGAIYNASGTLTSTANTVSFSSNTATNGGAIYNTVSISSAINSLHRTRGIVPHTNKQGIASIMLAGGIFSGNKATTNGGAIYNDGDTATSNVTFNTNTAIRNGGAIYNAGGTITSNTDSLTSNTAASGGAIYSSGGTSNITNATFDGNAASASGGAITNNASFVNVTGSTFVNNSAVDGGAIYLTNNVAHGSVKNSTFTGNSNSVTTSLPLPPIGGSSNTIPVAQVSGGGAIEVNQGILDLVGDTIAGNSITAQGSTFNYRGAGLYDRGGTISVLSSILTNNRVNWANITGPQQYLNNCSGTISDKGFNIESGTECEFTKSPNNTSTPDQQNVSVDQLKLGPLADHGGPTKTMALGNGSVAINRGAKIGDNNCPSIDQRGENRVQVCDIGAFEFRAPVFKPSIDITVDIASTNPTVPGSVTSTNVTWPDTVASEPDSSDTPTVTCTPASGSIFYIGITTVTCTAKDAANPANEAQASFTVTVKNTNNIPTLSVPDSINVQAASSKGANVTYSVTAEDASYPASQLTLNCVNHANSEQLPSGADVNHDFPIGTTLVDCTVTNPAGKVDSKSFNVVVTDYPTVNVPQTITVAATSAQGNTVDFTVSAKDSVYPTDQLTITCKPDSGSVFPIGTTQVTCTANNPANNPHSESFNVVVQDIPVVKYPDGGTINVNATDANGAAVDLRLIVTASNTYLGDTPTISCWLDSDRSKTNIYPGTAGPKIQMRDHDGISIPVFPITIEGKGTQVDCQATNQSGFSSQVGNFFVNVHDTLVPTVSVSDNYITVNATTRKGAVVNYSVIASDPVYPSGSLIVSCWNDDAKNIMYPTGFSVSATFPIGKTLVDCRVSNPSGGFTTSNFIVEVQNKLQPTLHLSDTVTVDATSAQGAIVNYDVSATDPIYPADRLKLSCSPASGTLFALGTTIVHCKVANPMGTTVYGSFNVVVNKLAPTLTLPDTITVNASSKDGAVVTYSVGATDLIYPADRLTLSCSPASGSTFPIGTTPVNCTATNPAGMSAYGSFNVVVVNKLAPTLTLPDTITVNASSKDGTVVTYSVGASDPVYASNKLTLSCSPASGTTFAIGTTPVNCTVANPLGTSLSGSFNVVVVNKLAPTLTLPDTITVNAGSKDGTVVTYSVGASDPVYASNKLTLSCSPASGSTFPIGITPVNCTATNPLGTSAYGSFNVVVVNKLAPTLILPATITVDATDAQGAVVPYTVSASDPVYASNKLTLSCSPASGSVFPIGITPVNCTATNPLGTSAYGSFNVVVQNHLKLLLALPSTITVGATSKDGAVVPYTFSASDPVYASNKLTLSCSPASGSTFPIGTTQVNCTATNPAGMSASGSFNVVVSKLAPTLSLPATITVNATDAQGAAVSYTVTTSDPIFTVDRLKLSCSPASGSTFPIGITPVNCTVTNPLGTSVSDSFNVVVVNKLAPTLTLPATITVDATDAQGAVVPYTFSASDPVYASNLLTLNCSPASGSTFAIGITPVNCTATNPLGTSTFGSFNVVVVNKLAPTLILPAPITVNATDAQGAVVPYTVSASDPVYASNLLTLNCSPASGSTFAIGTTPVNCTATNPLGTSTFGSFNVVVVNKLAPTLTLPSAITVNATSPQGVAVPYTVTTSDPVYASNKLTLNCSPSSGSVFAIGIATVNCTVTNPLGTSVSGSFKVRVRDAGDQIADMIRNLGSLHLQSGVQSQLNTQLNKALSAFNANRSNTSGVRSLLGDFISTVQRLRNNGISPSQADQLIATARQIQVVLGG